jgi:flagellin-like protein
MLGKRGISPLIATVLLIGFAVALGVMIMSITQPLAKGSCGDVTIKTATYCKSEGKLFAFIQTKDGVSVCKDIMIDTATIAMTCPA